jgi:hypothetical protein
MGNHCSLNHCLNGGLPSFARHRNQLKYAIEIVMPKEISLRKSILLFFAAMALTSCNWLNTVFQLAEKQFAQTDVQLYYNEQFNFEFDYPVGWVVEEAENITMLMSFKSGTLPEVEGIGADQTKIDIWIPSTVFNESFEEFVKQGMQSMDCIIGDPILFTLDNGSQAVEIISYSDMGGTHSVIYVNLEGRYFSLVTFGNLTPIQPIVRSLRLIKPANYVKQDITISALMLAKPNQCDVW